MYILFDSNFIAEIKIIIFKIEFFLCNVIIFFKIRIFFIKKLLQNLFILLNYVLYSTFEEHTL